MAPRLGVNEPVDVKYFLELFVLSFFLLSPSLFLYKYLLNMYCVLSPLFCSTHFSNTNKVTQSGKAGRPCGHQGKAGVVHVEIPPIGRTRAQAGW